MNIHKAISAHNIFRLIENLEEQLKLAEEKPNLPFQYYAKIGIQQEIDDLKKRIKKL